MSLGSQETPLEGESVGAWVTKKLSRRFPHEVAKSESVDSSCAIESLDSLDFLTVEQI